MKIIQNLTKVNRSGNDLYFYVETPPQYKHVMIFGNFFQNFIAKFLENTYKKL